jgi:transcriptional regulator with XRE-family HTH domain
MAMSREIEALCAERLRELRRRKGLTLHQCEKASGGQIKAVVLGSYERGTRAISLARLEQLAHFYEVPFQYFFNEKTQSQSEVNERLIFDLRRIRGTQVPPENIAPVKPYLATVARKRSDWNGEVLSLRKSDSEILGLICALEQDELYQELKLAGYLFASEASGQRSL